MVKVNRKRAVFLSGIFLLFFALTSVSYTSAAPGNNPIFATIEYVEEKIHELTHIIQLNAERSQNNQTDLEFLRERANALEYDVATLSARLAEIENSDMFCDELEEQLEYKTAANSAGQTIEEYLEDYLYEKGERGLTLYGVNHVPLGAGDIFKFKRCFGYEDEPEWTYHVALIDPDVIETYADSKESEGWELLAINYVNWEPGAVVHFRKPSL